MKLMVALVALFACFLAHGEPRTFECDYPVNSDIEGRHEDSMLFKLTFIVDSESNKAYLIGNLGSSEVKVLVGDEQVSFIEVTATGNLMTTAIDSELNSVHSRNTVIDGRLTPSQYYGKCKIK